MTWVILANSSKCTIYDYQKENKQVELLTEIENLDARKKGIDLVSDGPGHYQGGQHGHGAFSPRHEPKEVVLQHFTREIAEQLEQGRVSNSYKNLILIVPPHMHGLLSSHLNKHIKGYIAGTIQKDYAGLSERELLELLRENSLHNF